jgi:hypothetical protein
LIAERELRAERETGGKSIDGLRHSDSRPLPINLCTSGATETPLPSAP